MQPGATTDSVTLPVLPRLATTELFLKTTTDAKFQVVLNTARADEGATRADTDEKVAVRAQLT